MYDMVALGELLIDFATIETNPDGCPTLAAKPGGAPGNYLATLAAYGMKTAFLGKVGRDAFGRILIDSLKKAGIDTDGVIEDGSVFTTLAFVTIDKSGNRSFSFARKPGADTCLRFDEIDMSIIDNTKAFHFGTLSLTDEPARETTMRAVKYAKEKNRLITFDPNLRKSLWDNLDEAKRQIIWGLSKADIVKISDEEVEFLWGIDEKAGADKLLNEFGVSLAMITSGQKGCYLKNRNGSASAGCPQVKPIDTTGAGDIFGGSAVSRIIRLGKAPGELTQQELSEISGFACAAASLSTQNLGGIPSIPSEDEVLRILG